MLKAGIIGCGHMGSKHIESLRKIPDMDVIGVFDVNVNKAKEFSSRYNTKMYESADKLIENADIIHICTPTDMHKDYVIKSAKEGKAIFVEKPLCRTMNEADEIMKAVKKYKTKIMVGLVVKYFAQYMAIKNALDGKNIGRPAVARITRTGRARKSPNSWFNSFEKSGGVILDLMIHDIDFLIWCFGGVSRVYAMNLMNRNPNNLDYALAMLRFKSGVIAHLEASWAHPAGFRTSVEITGDEGLISYDSRNPYALSVELENGKDFKDNPINGNAYLTEIREFVDYVKDGKKPKTSLFDAYSSLEVALACLDSIKKASVIKISGGKNG